MAFRDVRADICNEVRWAYISGRHHHEYADIKEPARLTPKWIRGVCERFNIDSFEVTTERRLYWQRSGVMGAHFGEWRKRQIVGKLPRGGFGVLKTTVQWPGYGD